MGRRELEKRIRTLPAEELANLSAGKSTPLLVRELLASEECAYQPAMELAQELEAINPKKTKIDASSHSLTNYETQLALTELLFACERHWLQEMKSGLRASDAKLLGQVLKIETPRLQLIFQLALHAGLVVSSGERYVASQKGIQWLELDPAGRWLEIAKTIWDLPEVQLNPSSLVDQLQRNYPLLDYSSLFIIRFGHLLGLLGNFEVTPLLIAANSDLANAAQLVADEYPEPAKRLIVQGDLSIIAPGPLSPSTHKQLDVIAQSEDLGLACRFRISLNTVLHAMETGLNTGEIVGLLEDMSGAALPQPVSYLLSQAEKKFGELTVLATEQGSLVRSSDGIVLMQIRNEAALAGLMLRESHEGLVSRLGPELIYFNLRDHGYPAIMVDEQGRAISPRAHSGIELTEVADQNLEIAKQLISNEKKAPDVNDHLRQLQFALKNKLMVGLRVEMPEGVMEFEMTPLGIAGGRFRGRDVVKEAERTLPLSRIQAVWLS